jgi:hypothetical protein
VRARSKFLFVRGIGRWNALSLSIRCLSDILGFLGLIRYKKSIEVEQY